MPERKVTLVLTENGFNLLSALAKLRGVSLEQFLKCSLRSQLSAEGYNDVIESQFAERLKQKIFSE